MNIHHQQDNTAGLITLLVRIFIGALALAAALVTTCIVTGCSYTMYPDGSSAFHLDGAKTVRAIEILAEK